MFTNSILQLIKEASTNIPEDVLEALFQAKNTEEQNSKGKLSLEIILKNIELAKNLKAPICQDTGLPTFFVKIPEGVLQKKVKDNILEATKKATKEGFLRPNAVDSITGKNSGNNIGEGIPKIYFEESKDENLNITLLLKGGGSENVSDQISLPSDLKDFGKAERNLEGVKKSVLQIIKNAQGRGCAPGIISVHIGSDRAGGYEYAKKNLLEQIGKKNENLELEKLEAEIIKEANNMNIGPMGLSGKTTILDCKISSSHRIPASFFVTVSYMCWASRRANIIVNKKGEIIKNNFNSKIIKQTTSLKDIKKINFPISEKEVRTLKVGDMLLLNGTIYLGRDSLHAYSQNNKLKKDISGSAIYHCGPIAIKNKSNEWEFLAAGPTTSIREEPYEADFIKKTAIKAVIGKGGMGNSTLEALKKYGAVYLHTIGGAASYYAKNIKKVIDVDYLEEFGIPEAMWKVEVENFFCIVSMDSNGRTLH